MNTQDLVKFLDEAIKAARERQDEIDKTPAHDQTNEQKYLWFRLAGRIEAWSNTLAYLKSLGYKV